MCDEVSIKLKLIQVSANLFGFLSQFSLCDSQRHKELDGVVDNLNPTENGEAGEETHGSADDSNLGSESHLDIPLYLIIGGSVEVDLY